MEIKQEWVCKISGKKVTVAVEAIIDRSSNLTRFQAKKEIAARMGVSTDDLRTSDSKTSDITYFYLPAFVNWAK